MIFPTPRLPTLFAWVGIGVNAREERIGGARHHGQTGGTSRGNGGNHGRGFGKPQVKDARTDKYVPTATSFGGSAKLAEQQGEKMQGIQPVLIGKCRDLVRVGRRTHAPSLDLPVKTGACAEQRTSIADGCGNNPACNAFVGQSPIHSEWWSARQCKKTRTPGKQRSRGKHAKLHTTILVPTTLRDEHGSGTQGLRLEQNRRRLPFERRL